MEEHNPYLNIGTTSQIILVRWNDILKHITRNSDKIEESKSGKMFNHEFIETFITSIAKENAGFMSKMAGYMFTHA